MVEARKKARLLSARIVERQQALLDAAEGFFVAREEMDDRLVAIERRMAELVAEADRVRSEGDREQARTVARMSELGCERAEIGERLGIGRGEVRRLLAVAGPGAEGEGPVGTAPAPTARSGGGPVREQPEPTLFDSAGG
ncbi:hypothetical protein ACIA8O_36835 [Kitasatospora sp. NPDC051853]|uniref:hypothetical protein n=1 Tax=Kitasatospora sp. NPDC051853 TaxID=3364058 RepID=UPI0037954573